MDYGPEAARSGDSADGKRGGLTDMGTDTRKVFGAGFMLATLLASFAAFSQDVGPEEDNELNALEPAIDTSNQSEAAIEIDELEPAVPTAVLAQDVTRTQSGSIVMDRMELGRTEITGNQELPKVLYIVPWKKADPGDLMGRPVNTLLDEILAPLDREEFVRQVGYYGDLYGEEE
jgi:hypothetical protein